MIAFSPATSVASDALDSVVDVLPRIAAFLAVLIIGLLVARYIAKALTGLMLRAKIDQMGERIGVGDSLAQVGLGRSVSKLVAAIVRIFISIFAVVLAVGLLGVQTLEEPINEFILFLPRLLVALAIVFLGVVVAGYVGDWVRRLTNQLGIEGPLGTLAGALVVAIFVIVAAAQAGIPTELFVVLIAIAIGAAALTFTLAFGFGSQSVAHQITAGRYLGDDLELGQKITVAGADGRITRFESSHVVLEGDNGALIRVPNSTVLESIVTIAAPEGDSQGRDTPSPY